MACLGRYKHACHSGAHTRPTPVARVLQLCSCSRGKALCFVELLLVSHADAKPAGRSLSFHVVEAVGS